MREAMRETGKGILIGGAVAVVFAGLLVLFGFAASNALPAIIDYWREVTR